MKLLLSKTFWQYPAAVVFVAVFVAVRMVMQPLFGRERAVDDFCAAGGFWRLCTAIFLRAYLRLC